MRLSKTEKEELRELELQLHKELTGNILPFWQDRMTDRSRGGFYGRITGDGRLMPDSPKGAVLNARILWTFSAAYRVLRSPSYIETARRATEYIRDHFIDPRYGGVYWTVDAEGNPLEAKKQTYALAFCIYGLSEYIRASGDCGFLSLALSLYESIEANLRAQHRGTYIEAASRDWSPLADMRLSGKDANEPLTMNTHLHVMEAYASLYRVHPDPGLGQRTYDLIALIHERIRDRSTGHLGLFFDDDWNLKSTAISYGHDIEASWLAEETALIVDPDALGVVRDYITEPLAKRTLEALQEDGSIIYEYDPATGHTDRDRHWWPQAEAVVGFFNMYRLTGQRIWLDRCLKTWDYIRANLVDHAGGEWFWSIRADGSPNTMDDKAGLWKCTYHNGRMCLQLIEWIREMLDPAGNGAKAGAAIRP